jgi:hypothetical protein
MVNSSSTKRIFAIVVEANRKADQRASEFSKVYQQIPGMHHAKIAKIAKEEWISESNPPVGPQSHSAQATGFFLCGLCGFA